MKNIVLSAQKNDLLGTIKLTGSKSESNRALIMQALSQGRVQIENLSEAEDTRALQNILLLNSPIVDVGPAGTAMRFLAAFYTLKEGKIKLTGSERMKQRPIGTLVKALKDIGAKIDYIDNEGYPPIYIKGPLEQKRAQINIRGDISSQYISALLLIASELPLGLTLNIETELTSRPYVEMTLALLAQAGIQYTWHRGSIYIAQQPLKTCTIYVEPDWSAASYWYSIAALANTAEFFMPGLKKDSLQGDRTLVEIMAHFGISTEFQEEGILIKKQSKEITSVRFDFKECPDLAQTVIVCCAALRHNASFTGLETLKIKETDRIKALQNELAPLGVKLYENDQTYHLDCQGLHFPDRLFVQTYHDHRMAMAFAPLVLKIPELEIEDQQVVAKSYPHFWNDLKKIIHRA